MIWLFLVFIQDVPRDKEGKLHFHNIQNAINSYREDRIEKMKLINPSLSPKKKSSDHTNTNSSPHGDKNTHTPGKDSNLSKGSKVGNTIRKRDMTNIAPESMFKKMEGFSNAQIVAEVMCS